MGDNQKGTLGLEKAIRPCDKVLEAWGKYRSTRAAFGWSFTSSEPVKVQVIPKEEKNRYVKEPRT
jgi:hypothetical protein